MKNEKCLKTTSKKALHRFAALAAVLLAVCLVFMMPVSAAWTGEGTASSPYQISSETDMKQLATDVNGGNTYSEKYFQLTQDITLSDEWTPIGGGMSSDGQSVITFLGTFDGNSKTISNLNINSATNLMIVGLFGSIGDVNNAGKGTVKNLHVSGKIEVTSNTILMAGGIVGTNYGGTIENCYSDVEITVNNNLLGQISAGGIVSANFGGAIKNCYSTGNINAVTTNTGIAYAGGIAGQNQNSAKISNCYSTGDIYASAEIVYAGGIVGQNVDNGEISKCYALNNEIKTTTALPTQSHAGRVAGTNSNENLQDNFGWAGMKVNDKVVDPVNGNKDTQGTLVYAKDVWNKSITNFDANIWELKIDDFPLMLLKNQATPDMSKVAYLEPKVKLTYNVNGGQGSAPEEEKYVSGEPAKIASTDDLTKDNYNADGWYTNPEGTGTKYVQNEYLTIENSDVTLYVKWTNTPPATYKVKFMSNGVEVHNQTVIAGNYATNYETTLTGHNFIGWFSEGESKKFNFETPVTSDITLTAKWAPITYKLQIDNEDGTNFGTYYLAYDSEITNVGAPKIGYTFVGFIPELPGRMPANDLTVTAYWTINQYTITFNTNGGSVIPPITQDYNTDITAPANPTKNGYIFVGWDKEIPSKMPAENLIINATWKVKSSSGGTTNTTYTVTFNANGGAGEMFPQTFTSGKEKALNLNFFTKEGYTFAGWATSADGDVVYTDGETIKVSKSMTLYAVWESNEPVDPEQPGDEPGQPGDEPENPEKPTEPETPAPILAVLAGLGAAVVLRRK